MKLHSLLIKNAEYGISIQRKDGSFPAGHNGPWKIEETPVRVTGNWAVLMYWAYQKTGNEKFLVSFKKACKSLDYMRPYNMTFYCLKNVPSSENGLIGQVWGLQPYIAGINEDEKYRKKIEYILNLHKYDSKKHLWRICDIKGKSREIDYTLNHQTWFGVTVLEAGILLKNKKLISMAKDFFVNLEHIIRTTSINGMTITTERLPIKDYRLLIKRIKWLIYPNNLIKKIRKKIYIKAGIVNPDVVPSWERDVGYLSFTLLSLARASYLAKKYHLSWWNKTKLDKIIKKLLITAISTNFLSLSEKSRFAWQFNPTGFELAQSLIYMNLYDEKNINILVNKQLSKHLNPNNLTLSNNTSDPNTLMARIYEAIELPNIDIGLV